ncbi:hypothetical protein JOL62DRAFT_427571 [Phyllosticta paracitricarpa]|uniref:Uncharacterized protein n=1 Tax=Phyllosticta paracitricarpa TaxID=2016321 RepID=A0ABR1ND23_9PEZI
MVYTFLHLEPVAGLVSIVWSLLSGLYCLWALICGLLSVGSCLSSLVSHMQLPTRVLFVCCQPSIYLFTYLSVCLYICLYIHHFFFFFFFFFFLVPCTFYLAPCTLHEEDAVSGRGRKKRIPKKVHMTDRPTERKDARAS